MRLRVTSKENFVSFLKKLKVIEKSVLLEIDVDKTFSKVHTPDKAVMKYVSVDNSEIFDGEIELPEGCTRLKIGIMDAVRLIDSFKYFRDEEEIYMELNLSMLKGIDCVATQLNLVSSSLNIKITCADLSLLSYVDDEVLKMIHSKEDYIHKFKLYRSDFISIASLCGLETNKDELLEFIMAKDKIVAKGNSYEIKLNIGADEIEISDETREISIYKGQFGFVDIETSECYIFENRMVFFSDETETSCAVGMVTK